MFKNFKVIMHMKSPVAVMDNIILDSIISAAICKKILGDDYYAGNNEIGTKEMQDKTLGKILDKKYDVYCTSYGFGDNKEFLVNWNKRWESKYDDYVDFGKMGKIDIGAGYFKNYHMPLIVHSYKTIVFYVRGDLEKIKVLLENYINFIGKKSAQGYGEISRYEFEEIEADYSIIKQGILMRHIPIKYKDKLNGFQYNTMEKSIIPPYWRNDYRELCMIPQILKREGEAL